MDSLFFYLSKLITVALQPESWLLGLSVLTFLSLRRTDARAARGLVVFTSVLIFVLGFFPIASLLLQPLEKRFLMNPGLENVDGIIILGGAESATLTRIWGQPVIDAAAERPLTGIFLAQRFPDAQLLHTGGSGSVLNQSDKGASVAGQIFLAAGLSEDRFVLEGQSRNTYESAVRSKALINPVPGEHWVLVTSAFHMPRAVGVFCAAGWPVTPYPVDPRSHPFREGLGWSMAPRLRDLSHGLREWVGLASYWLTGRSSALFPDGC